ncbi:hypothetical protein HUJ04_006803 [Dendroctonus ponderosae]|nr:hypothetical protein HUJ04_006803 [Dendroctonus ponderosae]
MFLLINAMINLRLEVLVFKLNLYSQSKEASHFHINWLRVKQTKNEAVTDTPTNAAETLSGKRFRDFLRDNSPTPGTAPYFDTLIESNVTGLVESTVDLHCRVKNLGNRTIIFNKLRQITHKTLFISFMFLKLLLQDFNKYEFCAGSGKSHIYLKPDISILSTEKYHRVHHFISWKQASMETELKTSFTPIKDRGNEVSWVRHRDIHLLTVGRYTYTSDQRFEAKHTPHTDEWTLRIRYAQKKDSGIYECQISTTPPVGIPVYLTIVERKCKTSARYEYLRFILLVGGFVMCSFGYLDEYMWIQ